MTLTAPSRPSDCRADGDALAPLLLPEGLALTAEQFAAVCQANPNAVLELNANGQVIHMTPTGSETGARSSAAALPPFAPAASRGEPRHLEAAQSLDARPVFPWLQIDLDEIWTV